MRKDIRLQRVVLLGIVAMLFPIIYWVTSLGVRLGSRALIVWDNEPMLGLIFLPLVLPPLTPLVYYFWAGAKLSVK